MFSIEDYKAGYSAGFNSQPDVLRSFKIKYKRHDYWFDRQLDGNNVDEYAYDCGEYVDRLCRGISDSHGVETSAKCEKASYDQYFGGDPSLTRMTSKVITGPNTGKWFWWPCFKGSLPHCVEHGPFETEQEALDDARKHDCEPPLRAPRGLLARLFG